MSSDTHKSHGTGFYFVILAALGVLTFATFYTARHMHTGAFHTPLAVIIATVKAFLVVWFFMHLSDHGSSNKVFFATSLFFVGLMIALIVADVATRLPSANPNFSAYKEMRGPW